MKEKIEVNAQSSIKIKGENKIVYIDPYLIEKETHDADYIFITHEHYDHLSFDDMKKVITEKTIIVVPESCYSKVIDFGFSNEIYKIKPDNKYSLFDLSFQTVAAYNTNKLYHTLSSEWVGYVIVLDEISYYITGDTDITKENKIVKCDVLFVPIDGVCTMDFQEAATLTNLIQPKLAIPTHYETIVGTRIDAVNYTKILDDKIDSFIPY